MCCLIAVKKYENNFRNGKRLSDTTWSEVRSALEPLLLTFPDRNGVRMCFRHNAIETAVRKR